MMPICTYPDRPLLLCTSTSEWTGYFLEQMCVHTYEDSLDFRDTRETGIMDADMTLPCCMNFVCFLLAWRRCTFDGWMCIYVRIQWYNHDRQAHSYSFFLDEARLYPWMRFVKQKLQETASMCEGNMITSLVKKGSVVYSRTKMKKNDGEGNSNNARDHLSSGEIRPIGKSSRLVSVIWEQDWLFGLEWKGYAEQILLDLLLAKRLLVNLMLNLQLLIDLLWQQYRAEQLWCRCCCWKNPGPRSYWWRRWRTCC